MVRPRGVGRRAAEAVVVAAVDAPVDSGPLGPVAAVLAVVPPTLPCSPQWIIPSLPSLLESEEGVHALAVWQFVPSYPGLQAPVYVGTYDQVVVKLTSHASMYPSVAISPHSSGPSSTHLLKENPTPPWLSVTSMVPLATCSPLHRHKQSPK